MVFAQNQEIQVSFSPKSKKVKSNEIASLLVKITNNSHQTIKGIVHIQSDFTILTKNNQEISIEPQSDLFLPVKVHVNQNPAVDGKSFVTLSLNHLEPEINVVADTSFLEVIPFKSMRLYMPEKEILLQHIGDSISIPIHIKNEGNTIEEIKLIARIPGTINDGFKELAVLEMQAFSDTTIYYSLTDNKSLMKRSLSNFNVTGLYKDGNIFGIGSLIIKTAQNRRSFPAEQRSIKQEHQGYPGQLSFTGHYLLSDNNFYQLNINNAVSLPGNNKINYNIDASYWRNGNQPLLVKNTFINYEHTNYGITLGNINKNLDLNISGRGMAFNLNDDKKSNNLEIGYVQNGYNLVGDGVKQNGQGTIWGNFQGNYKTAQVQAYILHQQMPYSQSDVSLIGTELNFWGKDDYANRLGILLGVGNASDRSGQEKSRQGMNLGLTYQRKLGKYFLNSHNVYGSAYYPGQRRGYLSFNERISRQISRKTNAWLGFNFDQSAPGNLPGNTRYSSWEFTRSNVILGFYFDELIKNISIGLNGKLYQEESNYSNLVGFSASSAFLNGSSFGISGNLTPSISSLRMSINADVGLYETSIHKKHYKFHSKANVGVNYKWFSLSANIQQGYFTVVDMINAEIHGRSHYLSYYLMPSVHKDFLNNRLNSSLSFGISGNSSFGSSSMMMVNISYQLNKRTKTFGNFNRTQYSNHTYQLNDVSLGFTRQLGEQHLFGNVDKRDLTVFAFYDHNQNGIYDSGDEVAEKQLITINNQLLNTDSRGMATYKNLPQNIYHVQIRNSGTWYANPATIDLKQDTSINIPLKKIGRLNGFVSFSSDRFGIQTHANIAAITITAINKNGKVFETKTDSKGMFVFFLPEDIYTIMIKESDLNPQLECINNEQTVIVEKTNDQEIELRLQSKQKVIETKKFYSE